MAKVWAVDQGWDLGLDLAKALVAVLVGWPPAVELLVAGLAPPDVGWASPVVECVLVVGLAPDVGWVLAVVKDWGLDAVKACRQALLPGCV